MEDVEELKDELRRSVGDRGIEEEPLIELRESGDGDSVLELLDVLSIDRSRMKTGVLLSALEDSAAWRFCCPGLALPC